MTDDDLPGYLLDALRAAPGKGLRRLNVTLIGESAPMWQVSTAFKGGSGYHVAIEGRLEDALLDALTPPAQAPAVRRGDPREDMTLADRSDPRNAPAPAGGLFDEDEPAGGLFD